MSRFAVQMRSRSGNSNIAAQIIDSDVSRQRLLYILTLCKHQSAGMRVRNAAVKLRKCFYFDIYFAESRRKPQANESPVLDDVTIVSK